MQPQTLLIILAVLNVPLYYAGWKMLFTDWEGFLEALKFWITPDIISLFRGEYAEDRWSEFKLFLWPLMSAILVFAEYKMITRFFPL